MFCLQSTAPRALTVSSAGRDERHVLLGAVHVATRGAATPDARCVVISVMNGAPGVEEHLRGLTRPRIASDTSLALQADPPRRDRA